jgi:hypothetical protein
MRVLLSTSGSRGHIEPIGGLAARVRAIGAQFDMVAAEIEVSHVRGSTGVMPSGGWL